MTSHDHIDHHIMHNIDHHVTAPATTTNRCCQPGGDTWETKRRATRRHACMSADTNARQRASHMPC